MDSLGVAGGLCAKTALRKVASRIRLFRYRHRSRNLEIVRVSQLGHGDNFVSRYGSPGGHSETAWNNMKYETGNRQQRIKTEDVMDLVAGDFAVLAELFRIAKAHSPPE
jgi:hypothetical protein